MGYVHTTDMNVYGEWNMFSNMLSMWGLTDWIKDSEGEKWQIYFF